MTTSNHSPEDKALEALITGILHQQPNEVEPEVIARYLRGDFVLSPEDEAALRHAKLCLDDAQGAASPVPVGDDLCIPALYRHKPAVGFSKQTAEELEKKRRELREKLRRRKEQPPQ